MANIQRKKNIAGFMDGQGRFHPIRSPQYVGTPKRRATKRDKRKYSRSKAGDLGKRRQILAREDVFDREVRLQRERAEHDKKLREAERKMLEREAFGDAYDRRNAGKGQTLVQFVRSQGGINTELRTKRGRKRYGDVEHLTFEESGKRGLVTVVKGKGKGLDEMTRAAREYGYNVADSNDLLDKLDAEIGGGKATYVTHGPQMYGIHDNPAMKKKGVSINDSGFVCLECGRKFKSVKAAQKAASVGCPDCGGVDIDVDVYESRRKNGFLKKNPVGWFKDVSPATAEAIKKYYYSLSKKYHPDRGGDTRTMQQINADYDKAMKIAAGNEGSEFRANAERKAAKPLREAIEFAVTLPDNVNVVIRGLWLWLEGNTYAVKDQIKAFRASDGKGFKFASKKKAWFFAAVPSSNRRGEMSFDEIDRLHGRELVNERKRRLAINPERKIAKKKPARKTRRKNPISPLHPLTALATGSSALLSALHIKQMLSHDKASRKKTAGTTRAKSKKRAKKRVPSKNPAAAYTQTVRTKTGKVRSVRVLDAKIDKSIKSFRSVAAAKKFAKESGIPLEVNPKGKKTKAKNPNPVKVPVRRTYEKFQGRPATKAAKMPVSSHAPARLDQLGDLVELKLDNGQKLKFNGKKFRLCAARGKLWIAGGKFAKANPAGKANELNPIARILHVVYGTRKPHHGDNAYTHYIHRLGEETGHTPTLAVDAEGFPVIRGGRYKIEGRGIVN